MKFKTTKTLLALSMATLTTASIAAPYEIVDLGSLGGNSSVAYDINTAGQAVGYANGPLDEDGSRTFLAHATQFDSSGNIDLGSLTDEDTSEAIGINDAMVSVGLATETTDNDGQSVVSQFAVVYEGGNVIKLPTLDNFSSGTAYDINNNNYVILGGLLDLEPENDNSSPADRAFVFDRNTSEYFEIKPFTEGDDARRSFVSSINEAGDIVGFADLDEGDTIRIASYLANVSDVNDKTEIPTDGSLALFARSLNDNKEVVGNIFIQNTSDQREAIYIDMSAAEPELKRLGFFDTNFNDSRANDINNVGQIVGKALISVPTLGENAAFIYEDDVMKNLNDLIACDSGWTLTEARAINDSGQIVGVGTIDGEIHAFRLDPTGEPVEDCGDSNPQPADGGGSVPAVLLAILAAAGLRRRFS